MQPSLSRAVCWSIVLAYYVAGWLLFMVFAGVGLVALPLDCIREFLGRPKSTISKSEYIKRAKGLGQRANSIKVHGMKTHSLLVSKVPWQEYDGPT